MAEIAVVTTERKTATAWRPVGSIATFRSDRQLKIMWIDIFCNLSSLYMRGKAVNNSYNKIPGWKRACEVSADNPDQRGIWFVAEKIIKSDPVAMQKFWDEHIAPLGYLDEFPNAHGSDVKAYKTYPWQKEYLKQVLVIVNNDASDDDIEQLGDWENRNATTGQVIPEITKETKSLYEDANIIRMPKNIFDYIADYEISGQTMVDIANPEKEIYPRYDKPISKVRIKKPAMELINAST